LIRHGETQWNIEGRVQGHQDSPLTKVGIKQAKSRAKDLSHVNFFHVFSSDLLRARRTAEIIANEHDLVVTTHKLLRERNYGRFEGKLAAEFRREMNDLLQKKETLAREQQFKFKLAPDIESDEEIVNRLILFLREVAVAYSDKTLAVISHGGIIINFLSHLGFINKFGYYIENLSYAVIKTDGITFDVEETKGINQIKP
jgi:broad specificity phosphatase PhoE